MDYAKRVTRPLWILSFAVAQLFTAAGTSFAQAPDANRKPANLLIELQDVPKELTLPAESRVNSFVTAVVRGADAPAEVWLARAADSEHRVAIPGIGEGRYQLNLADDRVVLALRRTGGRGQCYVFAKSADGRVAQSAAIRFYTTGPQVSYSVEGGATRGNWTRPDQVKTISARLDPPIPGVSVIATAGGQAWPFTGAGDDETFNLDVTPDLAAAWERGGALALTTSKANLVVPNERTLRAIPRTLDVPPGGVTVRIHGSGTDLPPGEMPVPGSNDYLYFRLTRVPTDGTSADVTLHRRDEARKDVDPPLGHVEAFQLPGGQYAWELTAVQPAARPQDAYAEVTVHAGEAAEERLIRRLIDFTLANTSGEVLHFNGNKYRGPEAAVQLRKLYAAADNRTLAAFLRTIDTRQKEVGSEASIHPENRPAAPLGQWLRDSLRSMAWEPLGGAGVNAPVPAAQVGGAAEHRS